MLRQFVQRAVPLWACITAVGCASPVGPSPQRDLPPVFSTPALSETEVLPARVVATEVTPAPPPAASIACEPVAMFPAAQPLQQALRQVFEMAEEATRKSGAHVTFTIEAMASDTALSDTVVTGELKRSGTQAPMAMGVHMLLIPGALRFSSKEQLLQAMLSAVPYDVQTESGNTGIRLAGRDIVPTCKARGTLVGRIEGAFHAFH